MNQDTKPGPFNVGDHVRYIAAQKHDLPTGQGNQTDQGPHRRNGGCHSH